MARIFFILTIFYFTIFIWISAKILGGNACTDLADAGFAPFANSPCNNRHVGLLRVVCYANRLFHFLSKRNLDKVCLMNPYHRISIEKIKSLRWIDMRFLKFRWIVKFDRFLRIRNLVVPKRNIVRKIRVYLLIVTYNKKQKRTYFK